MQQQQQQAMVYQQQMAGLSAQWQAYYAQRAARNSSLQQRQQPPPAGEQTHSCDCVLRQLPAPRSGRNACWLPMPGGASTDDIPAAGQAAADAAGATDGYRRRHRRRARELTVRDCGRAHVRVCWIQFIAEKLLATGAISVRFPRRELQSLAWTRLSPAQRISGGCQRRNPHRHSDEVLTMLLPASATALASA